MTKEIRFTRINGERQDTEDLTAIQLTKWKKDELVETVLAMEEALTCLETRLCNQKKIRPGRKQQVLEILQAGPIQVGAIAKRLGISSRNVSSQLSYLRKDGYDIATSSTGKKMLL